jgi:hypothetical protein
VVEIADLSDRRHALGGNLAGLAGGQLEQREIAFLRNEANLGTGRRCAAR